MTASAMTPATGTAPYLFRQILLRLAKSATVVTWSQREQPLGIATDTLTQVSHRPQLISFCADRDAPVLAARHFAVHLLAAEQSELSRRFTRRGGVLAPGRWWRWGPYGLPVLPDVLATMFCETADHLDVGQTVIVLGRPLGGSYRNGLPLLVTPG